MKTAVAEAERLLSAIEELVTQETISLRFGSCAEAATAVERAAPLVNRLGALLGSGETPGAELVGRRVEALMEERRQNQECLANRQAFIRGELQRIADSRRRLSDLASYARHPADSRPLAKLKTVV